MDLLPIVDSKCNFIKDHFGTYRSIFDDGVIEKTKFYDKLIPGHSWKWGTKLHISGI